VLLNLRCVIFGSHEKAKKELEKKEREKNNYGKAHKN
jgi:hypothetical protein